MKHIKKLHKTICGGFTALLLKIAAFPVFAEEEPTGGRGNGDFASSSVARGVERLIQDLSTWLVVICLSVGIAATVYCLIRRSMADETDGKMWGKRAITAMLCAVAGALVSGVVAIISSYFV